MLSGPNECQNFLENTMEYYIKQLNASCEHKQRTHISHDVWDKFQSLNPHFFEVTRKEEVVFVCDIVVLILNDFCSVVQEEIDSLLNCKFLEKFDSVFVQPWVECVGKISAS